MNPNTEKLSDSIEQSKFSVEEVTMYTGVTVNYTVSVYIDQGGFKNVSHAYNIVKNALTKSVSTSGTCTANMRAAYASTSFRNIICQNFVVIPSVSAGEEVYVHNTYYPSTLTPTASDDAISMIGSLTVNNFTILICFMGFIFLVLVGIIIFLLLRGNGGKAVDCAEACGSCGICCFCCSLRRSDNDEDEEDSRNKNNKKNAPVKSVKKGKDDDDEEDEEEEEDEEDGKKKGGFFSKIFGGSKSKKDDDDEEDEEEEEEEEEDDGWKNKNKRGKK
jgi:hypothetical protein